MSRIGPTRGRSISAVRIRLVGAELLAPVQVLVLEAGQLAAGEAEPAPDRHPLRVPRLAR